MRNERQPSCVCERLRACGTTAIAMRTERCVYWAMLQPAIRMRPDATLYSLNSSLVSVDLPAPLEPTTASFWPACASKSTPRSSGGRDGSKENTTFSKTTLVVRPTRSSDAEGSSFTSCSSPSSFSIASTSTIDCLIMRQYVPRNPSGA